MDELEALLARKGEPFPPLVECGALGDRYWEELGDIKADMVLAEMWIVPQLEAYARGERIPGQPHDVEPLRRRFEWLPEALVRDPQLQRAVPELLDWVDGANALLWGVPPRPKRPRWTSRAPRKVSPLPEGSEVSIDSELVSALIHEERERYLDAEAMAGNADWADLLTVVPEWRRESFYNRPLPLATLEVFARDPHRDVRLWVTKRRKLTRSLFTRLARDRDSGVRASIALHPKLPLSLLDAMTQDPDPEVREKAQARLRERREASPPKDLATE